MAKELAQVTPSFLEHIKAIGLADEATARAIGISPSDYTAITQRGAQPSMEFVIGAIRSGLASSFNDVVEPVPAKSAA